jgi:mono/diheme cytochrome c family protein
MFAMAQSSLALAVLLASVSWNGFSQVPDGRAETVTTLNRYCIACHNAKLKTAGLVIEPSRLDQLDTSAEVWENVLGKLRSGAMPPTGAPRPEVAVYKRVSGYLAGRLAANAAAHPNPGSVLPVHRLTRTEYRNTIRDLLALSDLPKEMDYTTLLPADNISSGFDNLADTLFISPVAMERYLDAARRISRLAVGDPDMGPLVNIYQTSVRQPQEARDENLPFGSRGGLAISSYFPLDGEYEFQIALAGLQRDAHQLELSIDGERKDLVSLSGRRADDDNPTSPAKQKFRAQVKAGPHTIDVAFIERSAALSESFLRPPGRTRGALPSVVSVTITGPYNASGPGDTPSRRQIFVCRPAAGAEESVCAKQIISALMRRAYRRTITDSDLAPAMKFYTAGRSERNFDFGIERAIERMLVSPQFLFRIEEEPATASAGAPYRISDTEFASRLSFFLWSSVPDDELLTAAAGGKLRQPEVLRRQVNRMLADPRAESLVTNFAAQWLFLRDVESKDPDLYLFRDFDDGLKPAFERETQLFLDSILRSDKSVLDLLTANYTFLNEKLAKQYGIPNVTGSHFRKVMLPPGSPRAGLLGQGSILAPTSYATRTSVVLRGKYVLQNLLNTPPPAPPPNVPSLKTESGAGRALTMREAMVQHRADPACAGCHAKMDPIGFALENFDAVGRWRDQDGGEPIDVVSTLPDGTRLDGVEGVRQLVLREPALFVEALTSKLLMYAVGRNVQYYDGPAIRGIVGESAKRNYTFASLVEGVVMSDQFGMRVKRVRENK